jgi:hypothetical protein
MEAIEQIQAWLAQGNEASYAEGKALYDAYGRNPALKVYFAKGLNKDNPVAHTEKLVYELGKLAAGDAAIKVGAVVVDVPVVLKPITTEGENKEPTLVEGLTAKIDSLGRQGAAVFVKRAQASNQLADCKTDEARAALVDVIQAFSVELAKLDSFKADHKEALAKVVAGEQEVELPTWPTDEAVGAEELSEQNIVKLMATLQTSKGNLRARISKLKDSTKHKKLSQPEKDEEIAKLNKELEEVLLRIDCLQADDRE